MLIEWIQNFTVKSCKVAIAKGETEIGDHYHKNKDEVFYLLSGKGEYKFNQNDEFIPIEDVVFVPRNTYHLFKLSDGAILLGAATEPFDPNDEIKM